MRDADDTLAGRLTGRTLPWATPEPSGHGELDGEDAADRLCAELTTRWRAGLRIPAEAFLARNPELVGDEDAAFELVYGEFLVRESLGEPPSPDEFAWRFPRFADRFRRQLDLHRALRGEGTGEDDDGARALVSPTLADGLGPLGPTPLGQAPPGYALIREIGRGGVGVVYEARQVGLNRLVALKIIRSWLYSDPAIAGRFRAEAEAAARFAHQNIIHVYEVGEHDGQGFLALEYAPGGSLHAKLAATPQPPGEAAGTVEALARAVHYAHGRGIVHRDLKPANVVLAEDGTPKITDFGLAKLLEHDGGATRTGDVVGTPSYMAPEQARGRAESCSPATDVYALGAILYEMLTGRPPFQGASPLSTLEQVSEQDPLPPGRLQRHTPRDLETICLKCLEKEPRRRYPSALALADDLRRFLDGRPIVARPTPVWEHAWKWTRRRPASAAALATAMIAMLVLVAGVVYHNARLRIAVGEARTARDEADASASRARGQYELALTTLNGLVFDVQEKLGATPETRSIRRGLLATAIAGLDALAKDAESSPPDLSRAVAHQKLGAIYLEVGRSAEAESQLRLARDLAGALERASPRDLAVKDCLARAEIGLGELAVLAGDYTAAVSDFRRVVTLAGAMVGAEPDFPGARRGEIEAYIRLGRALGFAREYPESLAWFRKARALSERWIASDSRSAEAAVMLAWSYRKIADIEKFLKDFPASRRDYLKAIEIGRARLKDSRGPDESRSHLATALNDLGGVMRDQREFSGASRLFDEAAALFAELSAADPEDSEVRFRLVHALYDSGLCRKDCGRFAEAESAFLRSLENLRRLVPEELTGRRAQHDFLRVEAIEREIAACRAAGAGTR